MAEVRFLSPAAKFLKWSRTRTDSRTDNRLLAGLSGGRKNCEYEKLRNI